MAILIPLRLHTSVLYSASVWAYYVFMRSHWPQERARRTHLLLRNSRLHPGTLKECGCLQSKTDYTLREVTQKNVLCHSQMQC